MRLVARTASVHAEETCKSYRSRTGDLSESEGSRVLLLEGLLPQVGHYVVDGSSYLLELAL